MQPQEDQGQIELSYFDASGLALEPTIPSAWPEPESVLELPAMQYGRIHVGGCLKRHNALPALMCAASLHTGGGGAGFDAFWHTSTTKTVVVVDKASSQTSEECEDRMPYWQKQGWVIKDLSPYSPA